MLWWLTLCATLSNMLASNSWLTWMMVSKPDVSISSVCSCWINMESANKHKIRVNRLLIHFPLKMQTVKCVSVSARSTQPVFTPLNRVWWETNRRYAFPQAQANISMFNFKLKAHRHKGQTHVAIYIYMHMQRGTHVFTQVFTQT